MPRGCRIGLTAILLLLAAACSPGAEPPDEIRTIYTQYPELRDRPYTVEAVGRIVDGDTLELASGAKVRLIGVNTPEVHGKTEHYGREASEFTKNRLLDRTVYLFPDVSDTDRYGRLLRYLFIAGDPVMFNETLLSEGYANVMTVPPDVAYSKKFVRLEREAREKGVGLWGQSGQSGQSGQAGQAEAAAACEKPQIKGNINSRSDKIYHMPGGRYYEQTKAEQMFCTEEEARAAGFRKSAQ